MAGQVLGKVTAGGGTHLISNTFYGTCTTAAGTAAKIVKIVDNNTETFSLISGMLLAVKFTNSNTASNPTLAFQTASGTSISSIAAKNIYKYGDITPGAFAAATPWQAGSVILFVYDGTAWQMCDQTKVPEEVIASATEPDSTDTDTKIWIQL